MIRCPNCGNDLPDTSKKCIYCNQWISNNEIFCWNCGTKVSSNTNYCTKCGNNVNEKPNIQNTNQYNSSSLSCPNCGSHNIQVQIVSENKNVGCGTILLCIIFAWTIIGLILLIMALSNHTVNRKYYVCQNCGKTFKVSHSFSDDNTVGNIIAIIIIIIGLIFLFGYIFSNTKSNSSIATKSIYSKYDTNEILKQ